VSGCRHPPNAIQTKRHLARTLSNSPRDHTAAMTIQSGNVAEYTLDFQKPAELYMVTVVDA